MNKPTVILGALLLLSSHAMGKTYKCKDEAGNTVFSDSACNTLAREVVKERAGPSDAALEKRAIDSCLAHWREKKPYLDRSGLRIEGYRFQWVTVKSAGARRMLHLDISTEGRSGPYRGVREQQRLQCLMLGDGVSVNTYEYELEP